MENKSFLRVNFNASAISVETTVPQPRSYFFRCRCRCRLPLRSARIHGSETHVAGVRIDDVPDAQGTLYRRSVGKSLRPRHKPPHSHELLCDRALILEQGMRFKRPSTTKDGEPDYAQRLKAVSQ